MRALKISKQITRRVNKSIEIYLREVSKEPLLTPEEEVELAQRIRKGDDEAFEQLVRCNLRFVISVAKQYQNNGLPLEDLINEGNLGLIEAAKRFDETRGFKFISYAVWWIRQSILKAISDKKNKIRLPANRMKLANKIAQAVIQLEQENERQATEEEIAELLKLPPKEVARMMMMRNQESSLDAPLSNEKDASEMKEVMEDKNIPSPTKPLKEESLKKEISSALSRLNKIEAKVIRLSFGLDDTYPVSFDDIAKELGVSTGRVRQIRKKGLRKLKTSPNLKFLKAYL
jgi:RNA polymerase primary sigma factor